MPKESKEGITYKKEENFSEWYSEVVQKAELIDYTQVSGCYVIRPKAYQIWEKIQSYVDKKIKSKGVENCYFPLLIPEKLLKKESAHVKGFSPEVAWVTEAGSSKLSERLAIRPTSETIMYDSYSKWVRSYKDLPLRLNQWCSVIRWEFKHPMPFLRSREFLWQEGHTAFENKKEADKEVLEILNIYTEVYEKILAVPVFKGKKSEDEKFAGAEYTTSIETFLPTGKAIQAATSHHLGQNFSKVFEIKFLDKEGKSDFVYQNSWGITTRTIGIMVMMHSDNKGLVIPPNAAHNKVVIIPILFEKDKEKVIKKSKEIKRELSSFNAILDDRDDVSVGRKFNEWELKGIPIRIEIGPKDLEKKQVVLVRRDTNEKTPVKYPQIKKEIESLLNKIQDSLFNKAKSNIEKNTLEVNSLEDLKKSTNKLAKLSWCNTKECENSIKSKIEGIKTINISLKEKPKEKCVICNKKATGVAYFAKSY